MVQSARGGLRWIEENGLWGEAEQQKGTIRDMTEFLNRNRCHGTGIPNPVPVPGGSL